MNKSFLVVLLSVTMTVMLSTASYATMAYPHNTYACAVCHNMQESVTNPATGRPSKSLGAVNACVECHNTAGAADKMPFNPGDMSNRFNSTANVPTNGSQSTHNYFVTTPYAPAANVHEPIKDPMVGTDTTDVQQTSCSRCHDVHAADPAKVFGPTYQPLLRVANDSDQMCRDCHSNRDTKDHTNGTHPIKGGTRLTYSGTTYAAIYSADTTAFRRVPATPNPANDTSKLGNYLKNGEVVCSTCHAPHFADSNSSTFDNASTAGGFNGTALKKSNGDLLRTDPFGVSAKDSDINICSSCHKETMVKNHNNKNQNIQCMSCHAAHVDYNADGSDPNWFLLRRTLQNISSSTGRNGSGSVVFNGTSGTNFLAAAGNGACQGCHNGGVAPVPPTNVTAEHSLTTAADTTCKACHTHQAGWSAGGCDSCHGYPPTTTVRTGSTPQTGPSAGYATWGSALPEGTTPHKRHAGNINNQDPNSYAFGCLECHYSTASSVLTASHAKGTYQDVFLDSAGTTGTKVGHSNVPADYNTTARTCSNVYCHSNGEPRNGTISYNPPAWSAPQGSLGCDGCHGGTTGATVINTNAHSRHVTDYGFNCQTCHAATVDGTNAIATKANHANGTKDIQFNKPADFQGAFSGTFSSVAGANGATCSVSCHSDGVGQSTPVTTPNWTASNHGAAYCGSCHAAAPATNKHTYHFSAVQGPQLGTASTVCATCHVYADKAVTHANGVVDLKAGSCSPCHPGSSPLWTPTASVTCESCHVGTASQVGTYVAPLKNSFATSRHGLAAVSNQCTSCHDSSATHIGAAQSGQKRLLFAGNALCDQCHKSTAFKGLSSSRVDLMTHGGIGAGYNPFTTYTTAAANSVANGCTACHDTHGTSNLYSIKTTINGKTITLTNISSGFINATNTGLCQVCHTRTKHYTNTGAGIGHSTKWCLQCHQHKVTDSYKGVFAFQGLGDCNTCHGYPPAATMTTASLGKLGIHGSYSSAKYRDYSGGGGAHTVQGHLLKTITKSSQYNGCTSCHNNVTSQHNIGGGTVIQTNVQVVVDPQFKFNNNLPIKYTKSGGSNTVGSCSNVSCHFKPTPNWSTGK